MLVVGADPVLCAALVDAGYDCDTVPSWPAALDWLLTHATPDVVVTDGDLDMDVWKAEPMLQAVPIIALVDAIRDRGPATAVLQKPVLADQLVDLVAIYAVR